MKKLIGTISTDKKGEKRATIKSKGNHKKIMITEGYKNKEHAKNVLKKLGFKKADIKDLTKKK